MLRLSIITPRLAAAAVLGFLSLSAQAGETGGYSAVVLAEGAPFHGANGLAFDAEDQLHVASVLGNEIAVIDPETGEMISTVGAFHRVEGPDDVTFGPDGSLYWTSFSTGEIGRVSPTGERTGQFIRPGVNSITFSDDGRLFVSLVFMADALYEVDPDLEAPPRLIAEGLGYLNGMDWGADGYIYGPIWKRGEIARIDVSSGRAETVAGGFTIPAAVKFAPDGSLYVIDLISGRVSRVAVSTGTVEPVSEMMPGLDNLACDSKGRLFVSHGHDGIVYRVHPDGTATTCCAGGMIAPGGVAVLAGPGGESVFVADFWTLREFDGETGEEKGVNRHGIGVPGSITSPFTVSADGENLILTSWLPRSSVQVVDPVKTQVLEEYRDFPEPINAIRFGEDIVVAERESGSLIVIDHGDPERRTAIATELAAPAGLAADGDNLWVSDAVMGAVLKVIESGKVLTPPRPVARELATPEGLAVDADGNLLVVESDAGRLSLIDRETGEVSTVVEGITPCLQSNHPTWIFNGVAVGPSGAIYVSCDAGNTLYRVEPAASKP
jgi:sugar lactone lactonase YvrE